MTMTFELSDPIVQQALDELRATILQAYPGARFRVGRGQDDPAAIHLTAIVDVEDTEDVVNLTIDREMALQIDAGLPIFVIPLQPTERGVSRWQPTLKKRVAESSALS